jgi:Fe-S-cluster containining protein
MAVPTRQQRRAELRQLAKLGEAAISRGLPKIPSPSALAGLAFVLRSKLGERARPGRSSAAAELAHRAFEAAIAADPLRTAIACRKGCSYCCHSMVSVTAPEAFRLARLVGARPIRREEFLARAAMTAGLTPAERFGRKLPCAFLAEHACSAYASRPLMCRQVVSVSVEPCIEEFNGLDGEIALPQHLVTHAGNVQLAMLAAIRSLGLPARLYELTGAVRAIIEAPMAEQRWLEGDDIFQEVVQDAAWTSGANAAIERIAAKLAT